MFAVAIVTLSCGEKFTLPSDLPKQGTGGIDTTYVLVNPVWTVAGGIPFNRPHDVYIGRDRFLYVCDTGNDRVVKLELDGTYIEEYSMVNPVAVTQDRGLDLLAVAGNHSRVIERAPGDTVTIHYGNAIYRRRYFGNDSFEVVFRTDSPYGFTVTLPGDTVWIEAQFWGISASGFATKEYYVADYVRNNIVKFNSSDIAIPPPLVEQGRDIGTTEFPVDLYAYEIVGFHYLAYAQGLGNLGVQILSLPRGIPIFADTANGLPPLVRFSDRGFKAVSVDEFSNFYVLSESPDPILGSHFYLYKFDRRGELLLAFGTLGSGERQFRNPRGIDVHNGVIYIADTGNNRIVRYTLSTGFRP